MNPPADQTASRYVTCRCQPCNKGIEFDVNQLDEGETRPVPCPHCGEETLVYGPPQRVPPGISPTSPPAATENDSPEDDQEVKLKFLRDGGHDGFSFSGSPPLVHHLGGTSHRSAEQGSVFAQHRLGLAYLGGEGVPQNYMKAVEWFRKAAQQGSVLAQIDLAATYFVGAGVSQNYMEAYRLLNIAAARGNQEAMELRKTVALKMTPKQIAHAQRLSSERGEFSPGRQPIPREVRREVWRRDEGRCVKCGSREKLEYDHIIPVAKGGGNTARNLELLCETCNRAKSAAIQ